VGLTLLARKGIQNIQEEKKKKRLSVEALGRRLMKSRNKGEERENVVLEKRKPPRTGKQGGRGGTANCGRMYLQNRNLRGGQ